MKNTYKLLISRYEEQRPLGRPRCRWEFRVISKPWERRMWNGPSGSE